jgi:hypothetical protein
MGVGHRNLQVRERFVKLPLSFFLFWHTFFELRPVRAILRRARVLEADTYERSYRLKALA